MQFHSYSLGTNFSYAKYFQPWQTNWKGQSFPLSIAILAGPKIHFQTLVC